MITVCLHLVLLFACRTFDLRLAPTTRSSQPAMLLASTLRYSCVGMPLPAGGAGIFREPLGCSAEDMQVACGDRLCLDWLLIHTWMCAPLPLPLPSGCARV